MSVPLLTTKLNIPLPRPNLVPRPRLLERLSEGLLLSHRLILVSAKAGSGKTTLVSEWLQQQDKLATWLSLDANDNDPRRFFSYLVAALGRVGVEIGPALTNQMEEPQLPQAEAAVAGVINEVASSGLSFILVLDDYHLIHNEWIHQAVGFLAENRPPQVTLVLATRVDPPLPLARLRGRGQLTEIREHDLRFTTEEVAHYFNKVMELDLSAAALSAMGERTEGWIVGLQMAAISMQGRLQEGDLAAFIDEFGGTNRYILDYLMDEVLSQQPPAIRRFLIETSILERMCGQLCDAVCFAADRVDGELGDKKGPVGEAGVQAGQAILAQLERDNLFVVPLDDGRQWYRYHHLFADLLQSTLRERRSVNEIRALHRRASHWHQRHGSLEEAMAHAMAAEDYERAAAMIDENIVSMLSRSEGPVLLGWIEKFPEHLAVGRPWIDIYRAYTLALSGWADEADSRLEDAERRIAPDMARASELMGHIAAIRSYTANLSGDAERVFAMAALAEKYLPEEHLIARGMAAYALTVTYFAGDDIDSSIRASLKMLQIGKKLDRLLMIITALCDLASAKKIQGQLYQAQEYYERAHRWLVKRDGLDSRLRCPYEVGLADLLLQWNRLDAAQERAMTGIEYGRRFHVPSEEVAGYLTLMRVFQARGDVEGALEALRDAQQIMETHYLRLGPKIELMTARVVQWLAVGDVDNASRWAEQCDGGSELEQIALARLRLAQGQPSSALHLLDRQSQAAQAGRRTGRLIEILALRALALEALRRPDEAQTTLSQALALARPEGHLYPFLALGSPLHALLVRMAVAGTGPEPSSAPATKIAGTYLHDLLAAFQQQQEMQKSREVTPAALSPSLATALPEPLTERELEVLRLVAEGFSNREIAERLVIAPSTVKTHLKNLYGKLDVHSRTQAVTRGREAGLIW